MSQLRVLGGACACIAVLASPAMAGPDWLEIGDAGSVLSTAQFTFGVGNLNTISGSLSIASPLTGAMDDFEDMFIISVVDPVNFSLTVNANFDAQLFVFNITLGNEAFGLLANQGTVDGSTPVVGPFATDGSGAALTMPGIYAVAISGMGRVPVSNTGEIFNFVDPTEVSGPDGPGGTNPHIGWEGIGEVGSYAIELEGAGFYDVPGPGGIAMLAMLAGLTGRRRRR